MKEIIKFFRPIIIPGFSILWYILRPKMSGSKVVIICGDEVLLIETTYEYGFSLPGGGIKDGEEPIEAARRETFEEVGITLGTIIPLPSFIVYSHYKQDTIYPYYAHVLGKEYRLDLLEIDQVSWHKLDNLPVLDDYTSKMINLYKNRNNS